MSSYFIYLIFVFIGLIAAASLSQFLFLFYSKKPTIHLLMFILGILASLYLYYSTLMHNTTEIRELSRLLKLNVSYYLIEMSVLIWILFLYNGLKFKKLFYSLLGIIVILLLFNLIYPLG